MTAASGPMRACVVRSVSVLIALGAIGGLAPVAAAAPNIIVIVTDDHRTVGTMDISDPSLDPMKKTKGWFHTGQVPGYGAVAGGTWFPNGIATTPLCCPARASIFTGEYSHNHGVTVNELAENMLDDKTLQYYLNSPSSPVDYRTAIIGKYLNQWDAKDQFKDPDTGLFTPPDWDEWALTNGQYFPITVNEQGTYTPYLEYATDYLARKGEEFVRDATQSEQPFLLYVAPIAPHAPWVSEPEHRSSPIPSSTYTQSPKFLEQDRTDKPRNVREVYMDDEPAENARISQLRTLYSVDDMVHRIMSAIPPDQQANTLAFFVGDNGWHWGDHGRDGKWSPYEDSIKVPFYMRWPGQVPQNTTDPSLVANIDIAPTVLDAVNATPDPAEPMDGRSLIDPAQRDPGGLASKRNRQYGDGQTWKSIRTRTFVYIENDGDDPGTEIDLWEYYDLTRDPDENTNLLMDRDPENDPPIDNSDPGVDSLHEQLVADAACAGGNCPPGPSESAVFPADTAITAKPDANTNKTSARFVLTSSVPESTFECKLDGAATWTDCGGSGWPYTRTFSLGPGAHTLQVRATAPGGTPDPTPASHAWTIDGTPDTTITDNPPRLSNETSAQFTFDATTGSSFECRVDGGSFEPGCNSPKTYTGLADGSHTFSVRVQGDTTPATYEWTVDATPPTLENPWPPDGQDFASSQFVLQPKASEDVREFRCSADGQAEEHCGGGRYKTTGLSGLANGRHSVTITVTDIAGNTATPYTESFTIDRMPSFPNTPEDGWPEVSGEAPGTPESEVRAIISDGAGGWFVGGNFTQLCDSGGCHARTDLAHIRADKTVDPGFAPSTDGSVRALGRSGTTLYVVGEFGAVNGTGRANAAAVSTSDGSLTAWNPSTDGPVNDITIAGSITYLVGAFDTVGGATHRRVAKVAGAGSGGVTPWGSGLDATAGTELYAVQATPTLLYVGGIGTLSDGTTSRSSLVAIDRDTGAIAGWHPDPKCVKETGYACPSTADAVPVRSLQLSPDRSSLFVAGYFNRIGNPQQIRRSAAEIRLTDGAATGWAPQLSVRSEAGASDIETLDLTNGGTTTRWGTLVAGDIGLVKERYSRPHLAEVFRYGDPTDDGWPGDWRPTPDLEGSHYEIAVSGDVAAVGGNFKAFGFEVRQDLAFFRDPAPETTITGKIGGGPVISSHTQIFSYKSSETHSALECALDTDTFTPCGSRFTSYTGLSTGPHTFKVRARDVRGTVDPTPAQYDWTVQDYASDPDPRWPVVGEGTEIRAVIGDGAGGWYVGGDFSSLCDSGGCHPHDDVAHINRNRTVDDNWNPSIDGAGPSVRALALRRSTNTLYVGGSFTAVNGNAAFGRLAAIDTQTGGVLGWDPNVDDAVHALQLGTDTIYAGGAFGAAGNATRSKLTEISLATANATGWDPNVTGPGAEVWSIALGTTEVYAGGTNIGGAGGQTGTGNLVEVDRATGAASATWRPLPTGPVHALALRSPDASTIFAGGSFTSIGSLPQARNNAAEVNLDATGTATAWNPQANGTTHAFGFAYGTVLMGGTFQSVQGQTRTRLAQTNGSTGAPLGWAPSLDAAPYAMASQGTVLAVGGVFQNAGSTPRRSLAFYGPLE